MPKSAESRPHSPLAILTELAVEGTSSIIEAQRIFLNLAQQENDLLMKGVKERMSVSAPMMAMTDFARRSLDTLINFQQEFLTTTSKQTMHWLESVQTGKDYQKAHLLELARAAMQNFFHARQQFLDALKEETIKATSGKAETVKPIKKTELLNLAREASDLFIEAQKKVLDVVGQQMNVNLNAATEAVKTFSPARFVPMAEMPMKAMKDFFEGEEALLQSVIGPRKKSKAAAGNRHRAGAVRNPKTA